MQVLIFPIYLGTEFGLNQEKKFNDMKKILFAILICTLSIPAFSQGDYDDLLELLVDEKYEKLLYKAEKYTLDDKTKKHALPYLYLSMGYHEISKRDELAEDYPKAFKNSLKYVVKHRKKDKGNEFFAEYEDYFDILRRETISEAEVFNDQEKYTKSKGYYKYIVGLDNRDIGGWIMKGYIEYMLKSRKDSGLSFEEAKKILNEEGCGHLTEIQMEFLKSSIITVAEMLDSAGMRSDATEWLDLGKEYFGDDGEYQVTYNMIAG